MKKTLLLIAILILQASCSNTSKTHEKWIGESKQKLLKTWGPPVRIIHDEQGNDIFVYADQIFTTNHHNEVYGDAGPYYWKYDYMYVNKEGKVYFWRNEKQKFPPQSVDAKALVMTSQGRN